MIIRAKDATISNKTKKNTTTAIVVLFDKDGRTEN